MKPFSRSLGKVLEYRRLQLELAEATLRRTQTQQSLLEKRVRAREAESAAARRQVLAQGAIDGTALSTMQTYLDALQQDQRRAAQAAARLNQDKGRQMADVLKARRDMRIIERLKEKRQREYSRELDRKLERETAEWTLGRFARQRPAE